MITAKRLTALILTVALIMAMPMCITAEEGSVRSSETGKYGYAYWSFDHGTGELTISGNNVIIPDGYGMETWSHLKDKIKAVTVNEGITELGYGLFMDYPALTKMSVPDSVDVIWKDVAKNTPYYNDPKNRDLKTDPLDPYNKTDVFYIGSHLVEAVSFHDAYTLREGTVTISPYAFSETEISGEKRHVNANGVKRVNDYAFYGTWQLCSIEFDDSLEYIGQSAFGYASNLTKVSLPDKGLHIGDWAFYRTDIYYDKESYYSPGCMYIGDHLAQVFSEHEDKVLTVRPGTLSLAEDWCLNSTIKKVVLPEGLLSIAGIEELECNIPSTVERIEENCFSGSKLNSIALPEGLKYVGKFAFNSESIAAGKMYIPESVTCLTRDAFPKGMPAILCGKKGSQAEQLAATSHRVKFIECNSLKEFEKVAIPASLEASTSEPPRVTLDDDPQNRLVKLHQPKWKYDKSTKTLTVYGSKVVNAELYKDGKTPWSHLKDECTSIVIEEGVVEVIGLNFEGFVNVKDISLPSTLEIIHCDSFKDTAYYKDESNWEQVYPIRYDLLYHPYYETAESAKVLYIGNVLMCTEELTRPYAVREGTTCIASEAFYGSSIREIYLPDSLRAIGNNAFWGADIEKIVFPEGIERLGFTSLDHTDYLSEIILPDKGILGDYIFAERSLYIDNPDNYEEDGSLYIGTHLIYAADNTRSFIIKEGTKSIIGPAFHSKRIDYLSLPYGLECIGLAAFAYASFKGNAKKVAFPPTIKRIGGRSFEDATAVERIQVRLPYGLTSLENSTFDARPVDLFIPSTVTYLDPFLFCGAHGFPPMATIYGMKGTIAERLAKDHDLRFIPIKNDLGFTDVDNSKWYYPYIERVYLDGTMNGTDIFAFEPNTAMNRAMVVTVLHREQGNVKADKVSPFKDAKSTDYFYNALNWAAENDIIKGMSPTAFAPKNEITREQLATILFRYTEFLGIDTSARAELSSFPDANSVSDWAQDAMSWAVAVGLITGNNIGGVAHLDPASSATRAQVAAILCRYEDNIAK